MIPGEDMRSNINFWTLLMALNGLFYGFVNFTSKKFFGDLGAYMAKGVRTDLYLSLLTKHIGWHDQREHSPGLMSIILSRDTESLEGAATETQAIYL